MKERETWLDYIRAIACFLVAFIHFVESMIKAGLIDCTNFFNVLERTVYFFPVPIFFFCSGYLYQKGQPVDSISSYIKNVKNKLINLGIPYIFFTFVTIVSKKLMGDSVNTPINRKAWEYFLVSPPGQMWFLIILILCFMVIPTMNRRNFWIIVLGGSAAKILALTGVIYYIQIVEMEIFSYAIWFIGGMAVCYKQIKPDKKWVFLGMLVLPVMVIAYLSEQRNLFLQSLLSFLGIIFLSGVCVCLKNKHRILLILSKYMLQIYLLHTMCAACVRIMLLRLSINNAFIHVTIGLLSSFVGPILIAIILRKSKLGNIIFFPTKTWEQLRGRIRKSEREL